MVAESDDDDRLIAGRARVRPARALYIPRHAGYCAPPVQKRRVNSWHGLALSLALLGAPLLGRNRRPIPIGIATGRGDRDLRRRAE